MDETQDIALHHTKIAGICSSVQGMKKTFSTAPVKLDTEELPAQYTLTGSANELTVFGENEEYVRRTYRVQVAVLPTGQANAEAREKACRELLEKTRKQLNRYPMLNNCDRVLKSKVVSDSGVVVLPEFGQAFVGFEVRLQVDYFEEIDFAEQE